MSVFSSFNPLCWVKNSEYFPLHQPHSVSPISSPAAGEWISTSRLLVVNQLEIRASLCAKREKKALFHSNKNQFMAKISWSPLKSSSLVSVQMCWKAKINGEVCKGKTLSALIWVKSSRGLHSCVYLSQSVSGFNLVFSTLLIFLSWKNPGKGIKRQHQTSAYLEFVSCISCSLKYKQTWSRAKIWMRRLYLLWLNMSVSRSLDSCFKTFKIYCSIFILFGKLFLFFCLLSLDQWALRGVHHVWWLHVPDI